MTGPRRANASSSPTDFSLSSLVNLGSVRIPEWSRRRSPGIVPAAIRVAILMAWMFVDRSAIGRSRLGGRRGSGRGIRGSHIDPGRVLEGNPLRSNFAAKPKAGIKPWDAATPGRAFCPP
jgi:hypothetical protein